MAFDKVKFLAAVTALKEAVFSKETFKDAKLKDGVTIIRYDAEKLDIGVPVMAVTESGAIAIPDGDYEMEDGTKFKIVNGLVSEVMPMDMPAEDPNAAPPAATAQSQTTTPMDKAAAKAIVESIIKETRFAEQIAELKAEQAEFKTVKENFATQKTESEKELTDLKALVEKQNKTIEGLFALVEKIAEDPSASATETTTAPVKKRSMKEIQDEFRSALKAKK